MNKSVLEEIKKKREFSQLPEKDIEMAFEQFAKRQADEDEKKRLTKELLRKIFSAFISKKLLSLKEKEPEWILRKHISTRERLNYYKEIYPRIFSEYKKASVIDLGAGINGFSYKFFKEEEIEIDYTAIESVGQLVELMNFYFKKNKLNAKGIHLSLFELEKVKKIIKEKKKPRIVFLFKVIDALESLKRDYSKELISEIVKISDKIVVSFATKSLGSREKFKANRNWISEFIYQNFKVSDDFELGGERYIIFNK
ncbi:Ribosomal RNA methyltransferase (FmrO) [uncultured archaeon]|nr:Ribosomal RNA methyltransferase (FmrO) [uncultured archaeon]